MWKKLLDLYNKEYKMFDEKTVLIGHSTGSICALKYILESKIKIDKLILVSGFNGFLAEDKEDIHNKINPTYYVTCEELSEIKKYANEIVCIYGDNDPYIPQEFFHDLAVKIGAKEVIIPRGGHLNSQSGYTTFEEILEFI